MQELDHEERVAAVLSCNELRQRCCVRGLQRSASAIQFLHALAEEDLLTFDHDAACWRWDLDRIHAKRYTDNVVDLLVAKLNRLPAETQQALQRLACLGNIAPIAMLAIVLGTAEAQVHAALWEAARQELSSAGRLLQIYTRPGAGGCLFADPEALRAETI